MQTLLPSDNSASLTSRPLIDTTKPVPDSNNPVSRGDKLVELYLFCLFVGSGVVIGGGVVIGSGVVMYLSYTSARSFLIVVL